MSLEPAPANFYHFAAAAGVSAGPQDRARRAGAKRSAATRGLLPLKQFGRNMPICAAAGGGLPHNLRQIQVQNPHHPCCQTHSGAAGAARKQLLSACPKMTYLWARDVSEKDGSPG